jgi:hypothetical protein
LQEQEFAHPMSLLIEQNASNGLVYDVTVKTCLNSTCPGREWHEQSTDNEMTPDIVKMGVELSGKQGAIDFGTYFRRTVVGVLGGHKFLHVDGHLFVNDPPMRVEWEESPSSSDSGGTLRVHCCTF